MSVSEPTWDVVATVDEHPGVVQTMVAWHLAQGAAHVFLYCDRARDPVASCFGHLPQVTVATCDTAYWESSGLDRPARHEDRQVHNATAAYRKSDADWIIHIDADEYLWASENIAHILSTAAPDTDGLVVPVAERVHRNGDKASSVFEGGFRRPFLGAGKEGRAEFGRAYHMTYKGLSAHAQGKTFVRTGRALTLSIHRARSAVKDADVRHLRLLPGQAELLHFDGLTPLHWRSKLARMTSAFERGGGPPIPRHRQRQIAALRNENAGLYPRLKGPDARLQEALTAHGLWAEPAFDPSAAVTRYFPDNPHDLTPQAFDRWLCANTDRSYIPDT